MVQAAQQDAQRNDIVHHAFADRQEALIEAAAAAFNAAFNAHDFDIAAAVCIALKPYASPILAEFSNFIIDTGREIKAQQAQIIPFSSCRTGDRRKKDSAQARQRSR